MTSVSKEEFRRGWPILIATIIGLGTSVAALGIYSTGLFSASLHNEFDLSVGHFGLAFTLLTLGMAVGSPLAGIAVDRFGLLPPVIFGAVCEAIGFAIIASLVHSLAFYMVMIFLVGLLSASAGAVPFSRALGVWFDRSRGLALGIGMLGMGSAGVIVPRVITHVITAHGWRTAYWALAATAIIGLLPSLIALRSPSAPAQANSRSTIADGPDISVILRNPLYWRTMATFTALNVAFGGLLPYMVPMLHSYGLTTADAASAASLSGFAVIITRFAIGGLFDRTSAPRVAAAMSVVCAAGVGALALGGRSFAFAPPIALGIMLGAEMDVIAYFVSRYFGLHAFGRAYAVAYTAFVLGGCVAPVWFGHMVAGAGYRPTLFLVMALVLGCAVAFLTLPDTRTSTAAPSPLRRQTGRPAGATQTL
ncbi:MFS transporter [Nocardioides sp. DS6]|uniref:MFS transporter n=1 Tax=Nocardioides eburneus TaxID=3231482 RepID=A0ABV3SZ79_9ACTN